MTMTDTVLKERIIEFRQQVEIARSAVDAAKATVERVQANTVRAQAVLEQSRIEYRRRESLFTSRSIAANEIDKRKEELKVAEADLEKTKVAVVESRKNLVVAQNTVDYQLARLGDTLITAPFDGLIIRRDRDPGDVVVPGTSIFLLISTQHLWVRAWVDETEMQRVAEGQTAIVVFRAEPETGCGGKVVRLGRETDRETREFLVDVEVERLPRNWSVGQRADVFIETAHKDGVTIVPSQLIIRNKEAIGVIANRDGHAVWQPVKIGLRGHTHVEIVEGLTPGDIVVYNQGPDPIPEGRRLEITDKGQWLPLVAGRPLMQPHFEMIVDQKLGLHIGERLKLGKETYTVVGITRGMVTSGGDGLAVFSVKDAQAIQFDVPPEAVRLERAARRARTSVSDIGGSQPLILDRASTAIPALGPPMAMELLEYLNMADRAENFPTMLSGGQQQRVAVARALANRPSLILADEPTAVLDSQRGRQVMELFRKVAREQKGAVIVVTHDHRALDIFDTIYEMEDGIIKRRERVLS